MSESTQIPTVTMAEAIDHLINKAAIVAATIDETGMISVRPFPDCSDNGAHLRIHKVNDAFFKAKRERNDHSLVEDAIRRSEPVFLDAAWELSFRGILRPGPYQAAGAAGGVADFFSITPYGREWLPSRNEVQLPTVPSEFKTMFQMHHSRFGVNFFARAIEAYGCYRANLSIACCSMVGAASEAIVLHLVSQKIGEVEAQHKYGNRNGRDEIRKILLRGLPDKLTSQFDQYFKLLGYWRDNASHGSSIQVDRHHAFVSLLGLIGFCQFSQDNYDALTAPTVVS